MQLDDISLNCVKPFLMMLNNYDRVTACELTINHTLLVATTISYALTLMKLCMLTFLCNYKYIIFFKKKVGLKTLRETKLVPRDRGRFGQYKSNQVKS